MSQLLREAINFPGPLHTDTPTRLAVVDLSPDDLMQEGGRQIQAHVDLWRQVLAGLPIPPFELGELDTRYDIRSREAMDVQMRGVRTATPNEHFIAAFTDARGIDPSAKNYTPPVLGEAGIAFAGFAKVVVRPAAGRKSTERVIHVETLGVVPECQHLGVAGMLLAGSITDVHPGRMSNAAVAINDFEGNVPAERLLSGALQMQLRKTLFHPPDPVPRGLRQHEGRRNILVPLIDAHLARKGLTQSVYVQQPQRYVRQPIGSKFEHSGDPENTATT